MLAMPIIREANMPLTVLTTAESFVVTSLRLWFLGAVNPNAAICDWRDGFMQHERLVEAHAFLRGWIRPCVPAIAVEQSDKFVAFLTQAGLLFPNKQAVNLSPQGHEDFRIRRANRLLY